MTRTWQSLFLMALGVCAAPLPTIAAESEAQVDIWAVHAQGTLIEQFQPAFNSSYQGTNSLNPSSNGRETVNLAIYTGVRLWAGGEAWANLEFDQGFGLSNTLGVAGFVNGQGSKVGKASPYLRLQRLFFRQTFDLGGEFEGVAGTASQLAGTRTEDNVVLTVGKFSPTDIFDNNAYAHDPMHDFLNWALMDAGSWDYAADAWGYSYGGALELNADAWTLRGGLFALSRMPNGTALTRDFGQYQIDGEVERRYTAFGHGGKIKLLAFASHGRIADYRDAITLALATHTLPDTGLVRKPSWKSGASLNWEQGVTDDLGLFGRAAFSSPSREAEEFTDMSNSVSLGLSLKGSGWARKDDTVGLAFESGGVGGSARRYFALGGLGILIGDGRLDHYARENVLETYYSAAIFDGVQATLDCQLIANPAYNADRGPVSVLGIRLHAEL